MKNIVVISLAILLTTGCCGLKQYDATNFPVLAIEFRDKESELDLFQSGRLSIDSINISSTDYPDQHFSIQELDDQTIILFGPSQETYTISVGSELSLTLIANRKSEEEKCYTTTTITDVSLSPYDFISSSDNAMKEWSVTVWVD